MSAAFSFRGQVKLGGERLETAFVFLAERTISPNAVEQALRRVLRDDQISPDLVCYLSDGASVDAHDKALNTDLLQERHSALKRCRGIAWISFSSDGVSGAVRWLDESMTLSNLAAGSVLQSAMRWGLSTLAQRDGVVTIAPPGTYFLNPSQGRRSYFIRSGMMCRTSTEATFVAYCMLPFISQLARQYGETPNVLWVDTISIAYLGYALIELGGRLNLFAKTPRIKSFSSYSGLTRTLPSTGDFPAFIISASTSGKLVEDLHSFHGGRVPERAFCTIVGAFECDFPRLLYRLPKELEGPKLTSFETLREIRVRGEDFLFNPGEPQVVELRLPQLPQTFRSEFSRIQGKQITRYWRRVSGSRPPKTLLIDAKRLIKDNAFREWVAAKAKGFLPLSTSRIVYQEDDASKEMAELVVHAVTPYCRNQVVANSTTEIEGLPASNAETVAVVATAVGSGMELMRLTRALRRYQPKGSRYFIIGAFSARRWAQLAQLQANITKSDPNLSYLVTWWCNFAPGADGLSEFRLREQRLLQSINDSTDKSVTDDARQFARDRLEQIGREGVVEAEDPLEQPFVPLTKSPGAFDIGKGFAPWGPFSENRCAIDVLYTVACWLQNAREDRNLPSEHRLDDGGFQQTVLSPEFLLRFTDPVIQSSIFRCAHDSELDYRSSAAVSARCSEILTSIVERQEEASVEILLALAVGRIRLCNEDAARLRARAAECLAHHALGAFLAAIPSL